MRIVGYIMLHYGSEYLDAAIRSIDPFVEKINILYSSKATHQIAPAGAVCPDNKGTLKEIAENASAKINWVDIPPVIGENMHLAKAFQYTDGADMMLRIDSDEVWDQNSLQNCIDKAANIDSRYIGIYGFVNFWRSFDRVVLDRFGPLRIHNLKSSKIKNEFIDGTIYHFGYAVNEATMRYKLSIHGHKNDWKAGWLDRWANWAPETVGQDWHPCTDAYWHTIDPFDKSVLPEFMHTHPYYNVPLIK